MMPSDRDYPAAHSMDTEWFAVDRDGHVARFLTGEAGAMPIDAGGDQESTVLSDLANALKLTEVVYDAEGRIPLGTAQPILHASKAVVMSDHFPILVCLKSLDPVRVSLERGEARQVATVQGIGVVFKRLPDALQRELHTSGACIGCHCLYEEVTGKPNPAALGLFTYDHLTDNWISGPYGRQAMPTKPIRLSDLPAGLRDKLGTFQFPSLCFADSRHIQPIEHAECESWESAYMACDGRTVRPIPGKGDEYIEAYEDLRLDGHLDVQPPSPPGGVEEGGPGAPPLR